MITDEFEKINVNINTSQMEESSLFSNVINYVLYKRNLIHYYKLYIRTLEPKNCKRIYKRLEEYYRQLTDLDFGDTPKNWDENI